MHEACFSRTTASPFSSLGPSNIVLHVVNSEVTCAVDLLPFYITACPFYQAGILNYGLASYNCSSPAPEREARNSTVPRVDLPLHPTSFYLTIRLQKPEEQKRLLRILPLSITTHRSWVNILEYMDNRWYNLLCHVWHYRPLYHHVLHPAHTPASTSS
jgi:hypothetical protein